MADHVTTASKRQLLRPLGAPSGDDMAAVAKVVDTQLSRRPALAARRAPYSAEGLDCNGQDARGAGCRPAVRRSIDKGLLGRHRPPRLSARPAATPGGQ